MSTPVSYTCTFSDPKYVDGSLPSSPYNYSFQWQFYKETCTYNGAIYAPSTTTASSTDIQVYASLTAGEVLMALMMFVLIVIELGKMIAHGLNKIKTKKTFLSYSGGDVEIRNDL